MSFIGGSTAATMSKFRESLARGASNARSRRAAVDVGLVFDFDPRKAKNHKLRGPVQCPMRVTVLLDGRMTTLKVARGCEMDTVGAMIVGACDVKGDSDVKVRVELLAHTESRSSMMLAHKDYSKKLLRVVSDLQKNLPDRDERDDGRPRRPRRMRTLRKPLEARAASLPELGITNRDGAKAARRRGARTGGLTPRTKHAMRPSAYRDVAAERGATTVHIPTRVFDKEGNVTIHPCSCVWCAIATPVVAEEARPHMFETSATYDEGLELVQRLEDGARLSDRLELRAAALCKQLQQDLASGCPPAKLSKFDDPTVVGKNRVLEALGDESASLLSSSTHRMDEDEAPAPAAPLASTPTPTLRTLVRFDLSAQAPAPPPPILSPSDPLTVPSVTVKVIHSPASSPEKILPLPQGITTMTDPAGAPFSLAGIRKLPHPRTFEGSFTTGDHAKWKEPIRFPADPASSSFPSSPGGSLASLAPELSVATLN